MHSWVIQITVKPSHLAAKRTPFYVTQNLHHDCTTTAIHQAQHEHPHQHLVNINTVSKALPNEKHSSLKHHLQLTAIADTLDKNKHVKKYVGKAA